MVKVLKSNQQHEKLWYRFTTLESVEHSMCFIFTSLGSISTAYDD